MIQAAGSPSTDRSMMHIRYFAWMRERTGLAGEDVALPMGVDTVADLIGWLRARGPEYEAAFADARFVRAALDQAHVPHDAPLAGAREVAFFPPMTGG